jgi:NADH-quinone oxidoreductase subunit L
VSDLLVILIPVFPLIAVLVNGLLGHRYAVDLAGRLAVGSIGLSFLCAVAVVTGVLSDPTPREVIAYSWIFGGDLHVNFGFLIDPLTAVMLMVVTGVGFLIHVYSIGYMHGEDGFTRFFVYMNLFMVSMLLLVMGNNFLVLFIGWEGVGLCSYLLIGYYFNKVSAAKAATKAFVVNRIGDAGFLLAIFLVFVNFKTLDYLKVFENANQLSIEMATAITLCLLVGAIGKSAQIPLYTWLPDAMEGPTPVSALIHAATMVTAGVYMIARSSAIYSRAPEVMMIVAAVGIFTALFAASIALFQSDIKKVLAYSTISQLGYMVTAMGVGAVTAGVFHLATHAFFKALLFLGSGSVILALHHEQDMMKMGGLKKYLPTTCWTMWVGTLAIAGVPGLAGFFSKDEILWRAFSLPQGHLVIWLLGVLIAGMTAFYMFRMMFLTFHGKEQHASDSGHHPHESPRVMLVPLMILAVGSILVGYLGLPAWLGPNLFEEFLEPALHTAYIPLDEGHHSHSLEILLTVVSVAVAALGIFLAYFFFLAHPSRADQLKERFQTFYGWAYNKYYVDELYDTLFVNRCKDLGNALTVFDQYVVDGIVNGSAAATRMTAWISGKADIHIVDRLVNLAAEIVEFFSSKVFSRIQTGLVQRYLAVFVLGVIFVIGFYLYSGA